MHHIGTHLRQIELRLHGQRSRDTSPSYTGGLRSLFARLDIHMLSQFLAEPAPKKRQVLLNPYNPILLLRSHVTQTTTPNPEFFGRLKKSLWLMVSFSYMWHGLKITNS